MAHSVQKRSDYYALRRQGWTQTAASAHVHVALRTARNWEKAEKSSSGQDWRQWKLQAKLPGPKEVEDLSEDAKRALDDFAYWRWRYLARRSTPWQEEAAHSVLQWLLAPDTEFVVVNCPPTSGKSTLFAHDVPAWLICRERSIRILLGSNTQRMASQYSNRIRRLLERVRPLPPNLANGQETAAQGCLAVDYGRFKPEISDIWRREEFTVTGLDETPLEDKEPTVAAFGMDTEFLGARANLVIWDDLVVGKTLRTQEAIENQRKWWEEEGVTRVEPGGALILQGQRMGASDLYRYCLDQIYEDDETRSRWRHVVYPAHFEDRCEQLHAPDAPAYPEGCLLDPVRIPWRGTAGLLSIQRNRNEKYRVQYQQEDVDPSSVLVPLVWINGGKDSDGVDHPGCWDDRELCEVPEGLSSPWFSIATADPSPTKFWAIEWWLYHPDSQQRFLLDLIKQSMEASDFLDWNETSGKFYGIMHEWQLRSVDLGYPINRWIIEINAAQRFLLQYDHVKRWQRQHQVLIVPHSTTRNKLDPEYGIQSIAPRFKYGNVRLPGSNRRDRGGTRQRLDGDEHDTSKSIARIASMKLVEEATHYPDPHFGDDALMAYWFLEYHLPTLTRDHKPIPKMRRPSWMRREELVA